MSRTDLAALILAAGEGKRMKSGLAKVLQHVCGQPMIRYVVRAVRAVQPSRVIVVVGKQAEAVQEELSEEELTFVLQEERLGTGHAALVAEPVLSDFHGTILVLNGDTPLLRPETIRNLIDFHERNGASATVLSAEIDNPAGYGRIVRDEEGAFVRIIEHRDATEREKMIREINSGIFCFACDDLYPALRKVDRRNVQGEYYITDVMEILKREGKRVFVYLSDQQEEILGINDLSQLQAAERLMRRDG